MLVVNVFGKCDNGNEPDGIAHRPRVMASVQVLVLDRPC
jgi:hypothetical protein